MSEIRRAKSWDEIRAAHRWNIPARYNLAWDMCEKWLDQAPERLALQFIARDGAVHDYSYRALSRASNRLANVLRAQGIGPGDRVAILLPQCPETVLSHLAIYKIGAVALPLFTLFGPEALAFRLDDSRACALITDQDNLGNILAIRDDLARLRTIWSIDGGQSGVRDLHADMARAQDQCQTVATGPDDPAFISYTSGTTGNPKGALHAHRVLLGHVPGMQAMHDFLPQAGDRFWTPSDWAWLGGFAMR